MKGKKRNRTDKMSEWSELGWGLNFRNILERKRISNINNIIIIIIITEMKNETTKTTTINKIIIMIKLT